MKKAVLAFCGAALLAAFPAFVQTTTQPDGVIIAPLKPMTTDAEPVYGDPNQPGKAFVLRIRELPGTMIPPHSHPIDEHLTVLQGEVYLGTGEEFDRGKLVKLGPGGYAFFPKGTMIWGEVPEGAVVQVHGIGPFELHWKHPTRTFESPDANRIFKYKTGDKLKTRWGVGTVEKGWNSGAIIQYEVRTDKGLVMAHESESTLVGE